MSTIFYSPLEQFEFTGIGAIPLMNFSFIQLISGANTILLESHFDNLIRLQDFFDMVYPNFIQKTPSIVIEGVGVDLTWFLEEYFILEYFKVGLGKELDQNMGLLFLNNPDLFLQTVSKDPVIYGLYHTLFYDYFTFKNLPEQLLLYSDLTDITSYLNPGETSSGHIIWLNIYNSFFIVLFLFIFCFIYCNQINNNVRFYNIWIFAIDLLFNFLFETYSSLVDKRLLKYFPLFFVLFIFVFLSNLKALIPFIFFLTSNLWFTLTLSLSVWVGVTVLAIVVRGTAFFTAFVPKHVPTFLKPFLTIIEIISYIARAVSLGVRIFANMLAGHSLVHILADLVETCVISFNSVEYKIFGIFPAIILTFIVFIEFGICFLQALVFVILTAIYLNEAFGYNAH
jgi:F-type H+-transporting ATPase subunit a